MRTGLRMAGGEKSLHTSVSQIVAMPSPSPVQRQLLAVAGMLISFR
jgi:hypothetical protein